MERQIEQAVTLQNLSLVAGSTEILQQLDLQLPERGLTVLLGANGSGKSTLLRLLAGVVLPTVGEICLPDDWSVAEVAYLPEPAVFYHHLTVVEQLSLVANQRQQGREAVQTAIELWQLQAVANQRTSQLSLGYRQRLGLAQALLREPKLLLLDEPMNGMDPELAAFFEQQMKQLKERCCVVMATHLLHHVDDWVDFVVVMHQGRILAAEQKPKAQGLYDFYQSVMQQQSVRN